MKGPSRTDPALLRGRTRRNTTVNFAGAARAGRARRRADRGRDVDDAARRASPCPRPRDRARPRARLGRLLNVRDLGGHPTEDGGETRFGRDRPRGQRATLSEEGWEALVAYGIRTSLDLRFDEELDGDPPGDAAGRRRPRVGLLGRRDPDGWTLDRAGADGRPTRPPRRPRRTSSRSSAGQRSRPRSRPWRTRRRAACSCTARPARTARASSPRCCCASRVSFRRKWQPTMPSARRSSHLVSTSGSLRRRTTRSGRGSAISATPGAAMVEVLAELSSNTAARPGTSARAARSKVCSNVRGRACATEHAGLTIDRDEVGTNGHTSVRCFSLGSQWVVGRGAPSRAAGDMADFAGLVIAIFGPTASGKTAVAEELAVRIPADVVSADSAALYRGLKTMTATPPPPTRLVGVLDLHEEASVVDYQRRAHLAIDEILAAGRTPVVVGGTGLYLRAALSDLTPPPAPEAGERERWERIYDRLGAERAHAARRARSGRCGTRARERPQEGGPGAGAHQRRRVARTRGEHALGRGHATSDGARRARRPGRRARPPDRCAGGADDRERCRGGGETRAGRAYLPDRVEDHGPSRGGRDSPPEEAAEALARASRRLARYQRKWLRRLPGLVTLDAARPAGEVATAILEVAQSQTCQARGR